MRRRCGGRNDDRSLGSKRGFDRSLQTIPVTPPAHYSFQAPQPTWHDCLISKAEARSSDVTVVVVLDGDDCCLCERRQACSTTQL